MATVISGREIVIAHQVLHGACNEVVANPLIYSNMDAVVDPVFTEMTLSEYVPRSFNHSDVVLGRYPRNTLLDTRQGQLVVCGDNVIKEQVSPWLQNPHLAVEEVHREAGGATAIDIPTFLAARFGETTWGHWLLEILPKIAIAERTFPGLFVFAVPENIVSRTDGSRSYGTAIIESLCAYGISPERILPVGKFRLYEFSSLFDVFGSHYGNVPHPLAREALRAPFRDLQEVSQHRRLAVLRGERERRSILNRSDVLRTLVDDGFHSVDLTSTTFIDQVRLFSSASTVVGELGSGLASLAFAKENVAVVTLGPAHWHDSYFIPLAQMLDALLADVRGASTQLTVPGSNFKRCPADSYYVIPPDDVTKAVQTVERVETRNGNWVTIVAGKHRPRRLGRQLCRIEFGFPKRRIDLQLRGFHLAEADVEWSSGSEAEIKLFNLGVCNGNMWLEIRGIGFVAPPMYLFKRVHISVDDVEVGSFYLHGSCHEFIYLPSHLVQGMPLTLGIRHKCCPSPRSLGIGDDDRDLGLGLKSISFYETGNCEDLDFSQPA